jgi:hypothetical protein
MSDWKPIETAPRDGSHILLYTTNDDGLPVAIEGTWLSSHDCDWNDASGFVEVFENSEVYPTHWAPLLEPPENYDD